MLVDTHLSLDLPDEEATLDLGRRLARALPPSPAEPFVIHLTGELGAGKTCLARGLLRERGVRDAIRSPTYSLLEVYDTGGFTFAHLDLYRLTSPQELEPLSLREFLAPDHVLLIEWPDRGGPEVPSADLVIELLPRDPGRTARMTAGSAAGGKLLNDITVNTGTVGPGTVSEEPAR